MAETYLMEDEREANRLAEKVDAEAWVEHYLAPHLRLGMRVLDTGCGPGTIAAAVAHGFPNVEIVALDASPARVAVAEANLAGMDNACARAGDILALPFPDASFDLVCCRFLLEYVPDKERAVAELARVCRPGGMVLLQDLDAQLVSHYPPDPELEQGLADALALLERRGFDPLVGRKLFHLLQSTGIQASAVTASSYHLVAGSIDPIERARWELKLEIASRALERDGLANADALKARFLDYLDRSDTLSFSQVFTTWGTKPPLSF